MSEKYEAILATRAYVDEVIENLGSIGGIGSVVASVLGYHRVAVLCQQGGWGVLHSRPSG